MQTIELFFNAEEIIEAVMLRLEYMAGKRSDTVEGYYRLSADKPDRRMLDMLFRRAVRRMAASLGSSVLALLTEEDADSPGGLASGCRLTASVKKTDISAAVAEDIGQMVIEDMILAEWLSVISESESEPVRLRWHESLHLLVAMLGAEEPSQSVSSGDGYETSRGVKASSRRFPPL